MEAVSLISTYGLVLHYFHLHPKSTMKDAATALNLTEKSIYYNLRALENDPRKLVTVQRTGRRAWRRPHAEIAKALDRFVEVASKAKIA